MNLADVGLEKTVTLFLALGNGNGQREERKTYIRQALHVALIFLILNPYFYFYFNF